MKRQPAIFPHTIKTGSVSVKIYRTKSRGYDQFQVADYSSEPMNGGSWGGLRPDPALIHKTLSRNAN